MGYPCHPDRLFVHAVCMTYGVKGGWFAREGLWFIDHYAQPLYLSGASQAQRYRRFGATPLRVTLHNRTLTPHVYLPCRYPAWTYLKADASYRAFKHAVVAAQVGKQAQRMR